MPTTSISPDVISRAPASRTSDAGSPAAAPSRSPSSCSSTPSQRTEFDKKAECITNESQITAQDSLDALLRCDKEFIVQDYINAILAATLPPLSPSLHVSRSPHIFSSPHIFCSRHISNIDYKHISSIFAYLTPQAGRSVDLKQSYDFIMAVNTIPSASQLAGLEHAGYFSRLTKPINALYLFLSRNCDYSILSESHHDHAKTVLVTILRNRAIVLLNEHPRIPEVECILKFLAETNIQGVIPHDILLNIFWELTDKKFSNLTLLLSSISIQRYIWPHLLSIITRLPKDQPYSDTELARINGNIHRLMLEQQSNLITTDADFQAKTKAITDESKEIMDAIRSKFKKPSSSPEVTDAVVAAMYT